MLAMTTEFQEGLKQSHRITQRLEVYEGIGRGRIYDSGDLTQKGSLLDGEVGISNSPGVRRQGRFQIVDATAAGTLTPGDFNDILTPYGHEAKLYRGIKLPNGSSVEYPLGVFRIGNIEINDSGGGVNIICQGYDRARTVSRAKLTQDYQITAGIEFGEAIKTLIQSRVTGLTYSFANTGFTTPAISLSTGDDPWEKASDLAAAVGCELYFDTLGLCWLGVVPNSDDVASSWTYAEGEEATMLYMNKRLTDEEAYNYHIYIGENSGNATPVRGTAFDDNPNSPTYYLGIYGIVPAPVVKSKLIKTAEQAQAAAQGALQRTIGYSERIHFNAIVNPAHDVNDVVEIVRAKSKVNARYVLDQFSIPLTHNRAMDAMTRKRQSVL